MEIKLTAIHLVHETANDATDHSCWVHGLGRILGTLLRGILRSMLRRILRTLLRRILRTLLRRILRTLLWRILGSLLVSDPVYLSH